jgi:plastocyanin
MISEACNFNPLATVNDGSCDFTSCLAFGCTNPLACNYDPLAEYEDGSCIYIYPPYDCDGVCVNDTDGDGVCNELEIYGCTDPLAVNYDSTATIDNDSCDYSSYTITTSGMNFVPDTIICDVGDTINFILGGYHNAVEVSDSIWLIGGTTSNGGFNFGFGATGYFVPDDCHTFYYVCQPHISLGMKGVIVAHHTAVYGCTDSMNINYNPQATIDDGSCGYSCVNRDWAQHITNNWALRELSPRPSCHSNGLGVLLVVI